MDNYPTKRVLVTGPNRRNRPGKPPLLVRPPAVARPRSVTGATPERWAQADCVAANRGPRWGAESSPPTFNDISSVRTLAHSR